MFGMYSGGGAGSIANGGNNSGDGCPIEIENIRLAVVLTSTQEVIGNLPVSYNYLKNACTYYCKTKSRVIDAVFTVVSRMVKNGE